MTNERDVAHTSAMSHPQSREPALVVRGVSKSFSGVRVLDAVQLEVGAGQVHALVGHNGCGKSTLIKALAGFHEPDDPVEGLCVGRGFRVGDHLSAAKAGMRFVHQDLGLVDELSTVDNLAFGPGFPRRLGGTIRWSEARRRSERIMGALGYDVDVNHPVGGLSASERTGVAIARALEGWTGTPALVVLDEPTASMPAPEVARLFQAIRRLRERGAGILYVSHHLDEVLALADIVTVLRGGRVVKCTPASELSHHSLVEAIVGRAVTPAVGRREGPRSLGPMGGREDLRPRLVVENISTDRIVSISFEVAAGEIVGFAGLNGSGRDRILPAIAGAVSRGGEVRVNGSTIRSHSPRNAKRAGISFVPANRLAAAVFPTFNVRANFTASGVGQYSRLGWLRQKAELKDASESLRKLDVKPANPEGSILTLSGGNQQKVIVGRNLRSSPSVLLLDEPTQGVDVGAQRAIHLALSAAAENNQAVVVSSSDGEELAAICHRVLVLARGRVVAELSGTDLEPAQIDAASLNDERSSAS